VCYSPLVSGLPNLPIFYSDTSYPRTLPCQCCYIFALAPFLFWIAITTRQLPIHYYTEVNCIRDSDLSDGGSHHAVGFLSIYRTTLVGCARHIVVPPPLQQPLDTSASSSLWFILALVEASPVSDIVLLPRSTLLISNSPHYHNFPNG
jgi:hypothetical protein